MSRHPGPPDRSRLADPFDDNESDAAVDAILRDDALLDALGRGELPANYRADVTARLLTGWRDDLDEGPVPVSQPPMSVLDARSSLLQATRDTVEDDTTPLPLRTELDRIDETVRLAFVAAGYARPSAELPLATLPTSERLGPSARPPGEEPTEHLVGPFAQSDGTGDGAVVTDLSTRRPRRRRFDRVVVATAAAAAILAAGSAGSVAAAATAHPGDTLWPISRVIYANRAKSIVASEEARQSLQQAREALARGDTDAARQYLAEAQDKLDHQVRGGSDEADALAADIESMSALPELRDSGGVATDSPSSSASSGNPSASASSRPQRQRSGPNGANGSQSAFPPTGSTPAPAPAPGPSKSQATEPPTSEPTQPDNGPTEPTNSPGEPSTSSEPTSPDNNGQANPDQESSQLTGAGASSATAE